MARGAPGPIGRPTRWSWEEIDPARSATSGDVAKIFKNERTKQPSLFDRDAPSQAATILAREVIQNSSDTARELRYSGADDDGDPFAIAFEFRSSAGKRRDCPADALGLAELHERMQERARRALGLGEHDCLTHLPSGQPIPDLLIEERGTTGMYGPWASTSSKLYLALLSHGIAE